VARADEKPEMSAYTYLAINSTGQRESGTLDAPDDAAARNALKERGLVALELNLENQRSRGKTASSRSLFGQKKVKPKTLQVFSRQMATMIESGVNVVTALTVLAEQSEDRDFAGVIDELRADVEGGLLLSQAMARHPGIFSRMFVSMVEAGEAAGALDAVLDRVAFQIEKQNQLRRRVKGAMMYPLIVLAFATLVLVALLLFLVPVFEDIFADLGGDLPLPTKIVVAASDIVRGYWFVLFPAIFLGIFGFRRYLRTPRGQRQWHSFGLKAPAGVGAIVAKVAIARFSRTLATLVAAGVDIIRALEIAGDTSGNVIVGEASGEVRDALRQGERLASPMAASGVFPPMVSHMVGVGEETGELDTMLSKIADFYEDEVDASISTLTSVIEPLMMILVGAMVGLIILAMYLPMFKLVSLIQ
jgi:type IV pilus assembly protein PilC